MRYGSGRRTIRRTLGPGRISVLGCLLVLVLVACGGGRSSEPPWGLDTIELPADDASVGAVLDALPGSVEGMQRVPSYDPNRVEYTGTGRTITVRAMQLGEAAVAEGFPATAGGFLQLLVDGGEVEVEASELSPDSDLVYVVCLLASDEYVVGWGEPDAEWMFTANADSPHARIALVEAFVDAARSAARVESS